VKFGFIAKHRGIWPADWMCGTLGVSRGGFYGWLTRSRSKRSRGDEELGAKVRASFLASDRTYGARRVGHDLLAEGVSCGLNRIERLMRLQAREINEKDRLTVAGRPNSAAPLGSQLKSNMSNRSPTAGMFTGTYGCRGSISGFRRLSRLRLVHRRLRHARFEGG
jgi:transposase InsO family protein